MGNVCIYCGKEKDETEFTLEHILPRSLGGAACANTLKTRDVCERCNSILGLFVDGEFSKSWLINNYAMLSALTYLDKDNGGAVPLIYMGNIDKQSNESHVLEFWIGPSGENIYCRRPADSRFETYVGGNPILSKASKKEVIVFGTTSNPYWLKVGLDSFKEQFREANRYSGNIGKPSDTGWDNYFTEPDTDGILFVNAVNDYRNLVLGQHDNQHGCKFSLNVDFANRFLPKIALGVGHAFLKSGYQQSTYAKCLRDALWCKSSKERNNLKIRGRGYWSEDKLLDKTLGWDGGHTIVIQRHKDDLSIALTTYEKTAGILVITDEYSEYCNLYTDLIDDGLVFVVVPSRAVCSGPISLPEFVAYKTGNHDIPELRVIEKMRVKSADLPAK